MPINTMQVHILITIFALNILFTTLILSNQGGEFSQFSV